MKAFTVITGEYKSKDYEGYVSVERYGHYVLEQHPMARVTEEEDARLMIIWDGDEEVEVKGYDPDEYKGYVPCHLVARRTDKGSRWAEFVCGIDLMENGTIWQGATRKSGYLSLKEAFEVVAEKEDCKIENLILCLESEMTL